MKKKILAMCLCVAMLAIAIVGGTLAYFTDTDTQTNVFTNGNIEIQLNEVFPDNELIPGEKNALQKEVTVQNIGSEDAYMWIELWIPADLDTPGNASLNDLHFNPFDTYDKLSGCQQRCGFRSLQLSPLPHEQKLHTFWHNILRK